MRFMGLQATSIAVVLMLIAVAFPLPDAASGQTTPLSGLTVNEFEDQLSERDLAFPGPG